MKAKTITHKCQIRCQGKPVHVIIHEATVTQTHAELTSLKRPRDEEIRCSHPGRCLPELTPDANLGTRNAN
jgi:hypothetical protein